VKQQHAAAVPGLAATVTTARFSSGGACYCCIPRYYCIIEQYGKGTIMDDLRTMPEEYWRQKLTPEQYQVCRLKGTERAFTGALWDNHESGMYECVACGQPLFSSDAKFDSGSGWPSFDDPVNRQHVELVEDRSHGMIRTEVLCRRCGAHLGHLFPDGPRETTGQRYCINSAALHFQAAE
jgi:peptide-methionine (R)-S-oxide reductase